MEGVDFRGLETTSVGEAKLLPEKQSVCYTVPSGSIFSGESYRIDASELRQQEVGDSRDAARHIANLIQISLGKDTKTIARGLFSALRELDQRDASVIYVEGIQDEGDIAAAVMNRLRKAATVIEK